MRILAIETSCDETAIAIIETDGSMPPTDVHVLASNTLTQTLHKQYGGVFPMMAKREHARTLVPLLVKTLENARLYKKTSRHVIESPLRAEFQNILEREPELFGQFVDIVPNIDPPKIDAIAVTQGPGLEPALWVGLNFAKALALIWKTPVIPVNHMEGHMLASLLKPSEEDHMTLSTPKFPALGLLVSGGHTELVLMRDWGSYEIVGQTKDDAVGEAFDKVARILGLPYPGGPEISHAAETGRPNMYTLPRPMLHSKDYDFSFSGLKTAVLYMVKKIETLDEQTKADIAREFELACVDVLTTKTKRAIEEFGAQSVILGGGVSANKRLRETLASMITEQFPGVDLYVPEAALSTDNALMIAIAAVLSPNQAKNPQDLKALGNWRIEKPA
jgi:N6-L-threonylcarbamoyladenine synthase